MRRKPVIIAASVAGLLSVAALAYRLDGKADDASGVIFLSEPVPPAEIVSGRDLYVDSCASCHSANLEGQADWQRRLDSGRLPAPPHDESGHTWHHSDQDLFAITKGGVGAIVPGYESDMPAFQGVLDDAEIRAVLAYIKSTWPEREREFQARVTANEEDGS